MVRGIDEVEAAFSAMTAERAGAIGKWRGRISEEAIELSLSQVHKIELDGKFQYCLLWNS
jgi:hypothetical protein